MPDADRIPINNHSPSTPSLGTIDGLIPDPSTITPSLPVDNQAENEAVDVEICYAAVEESAKTSSGHPHQLLIFNEFINGSPARVLFDGGATHHFISLRFIDQHQLKIRPALMMDARLASAGRTAKIYGSIRLPVKLGRATVSLDFYVMDLATHLEAVVGKPWFADTNPSIDWRHNVVRFRHHGRSIELRNGSVPADSTESDVLSFDEFQAELLTLTPTERRSIVGVCVSPTTEADRTDGHRFASVPGPIRAILDKHREVFKEVPAVGQVSSKNGHKKKPKKSA